jgi:hypothetical protein
MGATPTHKGNVTVKQGNGWVKIGECAIWVNGDGSVSGIVSFEGSKVTPDEYGKVKVSFRGWKYGE